MKSIAWLLLAVPSIVWADEKSIGPEEALKKLDEQIVVQMEVKSARVTDAKICFLNSKANYKDKENLTIFLSKTAADQLKSDLKVDNLATHLKGKKIRVTGKVKMYKGRPELKLEDAKKLKVIDAS